MYYEYEGDVEVLRGKFKKHGKRFIVIIIISAISLSCVPNQAVQAIAADTSLTGSNNQFTGDVNLSEEGSLDWKHWAEQTNEKAGENLISDISTTGNASNDRFLGDSKIIYSWSDGSPSQNGVSSGGKHTGDANKGGLTFTVPADTDGRVLNVYGSAWGATGNFTATLDDGTTYETVIDSKGVNNTYYHVRVIFQSKKPQNLTVKLMTDKLYDSEWGNVSIQAATLSGQNKPIIYLNGEEELTLKKNDEYNDEFVKAYDSTGDITDLVTTTGNVDTSKYGTYTIQYNVTNGGRTADTVTRTVYVVPEIVNIEGKRDDDGRKSVKVTGAEPGATIRLYDNTLYITEEIKSNDGGEATFSDLTSTSYRATQVVDGTESELTDNVGFEPNLDYIPKVILDNHPEWVTLYDAAWEYHKNNTRASKEGSGITDYYVDENFDKENIYQWDILYMALFNVYGYSEFPGIDTLDNFYRYQGSNGFISRVIKEDGSGYGYGFNSSSFNAVNPPLFANAEWKYYQISGDSSRFSKEINGRTVLERLEALFYFIKETRTYPDGTYKTNGQANGMDNTPGYDIDNLSWVDLASQQAQSAYYISKIAEVVGDTETKSKFDKEYIDLKNLINDKHWDDEDKFYYMFSQTNGLFFKEEDQRTPMGWWPMAANVASDEQAKVLVEKYIMNPDEFWRPMGISTVSRQSSYYNNSGNYWQGGVWAPTSYMTNMALRNYGFYEEATQSAIHYINSINKVFTEANKPFPVYTNGGQKVYDVTNKYSKTLWETYQPEYIQPGGIEDYNSNGGNIGLVRKDFVGWTGLAPIAMMIEDVIGFTANAPENTLEWRINLTEKHGMENFRFNNNVIDIIAEERTNSNEKVSITVNADKAFKLKANIGGTWYEKDVVAGESTFEMGKGAATKSPVLGVKKEAPSGVVSLTEEGNLDWILCGSGENDIVRKKTDKPLIDGFRAVGATDTVKALDSGEHKFKLVDGEVLSTSVANYRSGQGFEFTVPADMKERELKVYVSSNAVDSEFYVDMSDGSSLNYIDYADVAGNESESRVYTINYSASRDNQFVTVRFTAVGNEYDDSNSGVALHAVTLSGPELETKISIWVILLSVVILCLVIGVLIYFKVRKRIK